MNYKRDIIYCNSNTRRYIILLYIYIKKEFNFGSDLTFFSSIRHANRLYMVNWLSLIGNNKVNSIAIELIDLSEKGVEVSIVNKIPL